MKNYLRISLPAKQYKPYTISLTVGTILAIAAIAVAEYSNIRNMNQASIISQGKNDTSATSVKSDQKGKNFSQSNPDKPIATAANSQTPMASVPQAQTNAAMTKPTPAKVIVPQPTMSVPSPTPTVSEVNQIKTVLVTANTTLGEGCYAPVFAYKYNIEFSYGKTGAEISTNWDYLTPNDQQVPYPPRSPIQGYRTGPGAGSVSDSISSDHGIPANFMFGYKIRLFATGPNSVYSNWIDVPKAVSC